MSLNVDTFQMALMVSIGACGALITQYLDIKNVQEKYGKRLDIDDKIDYLTKVIAQEAAGEGLPEGAHRHVRGQGHRHEG